MSSLYTHTKQGVVWNSGHFSDIAERAMWAARGRILGQMPLMCVLTDNLLERSLEQGWPLIRVYGINGEPLGAGGGVRTLGTSPSTRLTTVQRMQMASRGARTGTAWQQAAMSVSTVFECRSEEFDGCGMVSLHRASIDLPNGRQIFRDMSELMFQGGKIDVTFGGPFGQGTFMDDDQGV